ncbi:hypothetical protein BsWGS_27969 [Bradybaena similaris]
MTVEATLLSNEFTRIGTYIGWKSNGKPSVINLVKAGFYYTGHSDTVRCFSCGIEIKNWQKNSDPLTVHSSRNPGCQFVPYSDSKSRQGCASPASEQSSNNSPMDSPAPLTPCAICPNSELANKETVRNLPARVNSFCFRGPWRRNCAVTQTCSSNRSERNSETASQISTANPQATRANNTSRGDNQLETCSRTPVQRRRSDGAERSLKKHTQTIATRQFSSSDFHPSEFQASEEARFQTYTRWTSITVARAREFANAGFVYVGPGDRVQCVFCNGMLHLWKSDDSPACEHMKHFPRCRYVVEYLAVVKLAVPKHGKYRTEASRLGSFGDWDPHKNPKPAALAKAGFFYTGRKDRVRCFCCSGGLCEWDANDDPWVEHARWFPNCPYVKQAKGQVFINAVLSSSKFTKMQSANVGITQDRLLAKEYLKRIIDGKVPSRMDNPIMKAVLRLDIPKKFVKKAIRQTLAERGEDFTNEAALLEAMFGVSKQSDHNARATKELRASTDGAAALTTSKNFSKLAEENQKLKEQKLCKICLDEDACVAFIPCGHLVCSSCAPALSLCPICRAKITGTIRTYMS